MADKDWRVTIEVSETGVGRLMDATFCIRDHTSVPLADPLSAQTVVDDVAAWLTNSWKTVTGTWLKIERFIVRELGTSSPTSAEHIVNVAGTLPAGTQPMPYAVCAIASLKTNLATRSGRGRFHFPWPGNASYLSNGASWNLAGLYYTQCAATLATILGGHDDTHDTVLHHYSLRVWSKRLQESNDVTSAIVRANPGYVRSRLTVP